MDPLGDMRGKSKMHNALPTADSQSLLFVAGGYNADEVNSEDFVSKVELLKLDGGDGCPEPPGNFPGRIYGAMGTTIGERDDGRLPNRPNNRRWGRLRS